MVPGWGGVVVDDSADAADRAARAAAIVCMAALLSCTLSCSPETAVAIAVMASAIPASPVAASYTHLTRPTNREVSTSGVVVHTANT